MDASILLVGSNDFQASLLNLVPNRTTLAVERAIDPSGAMQIIQAQQPDLLVIQASRAEGLDLCRQVKTQNRIAWIYCILIDDQSVDELPDRDREIKARIEALEVGADAYLWLPLAYKPEIAHHFAIQSRWFQAQIQAGLRQVQNHRDLMRTNDVLSAIALSDPLTELNNRRAFEWELPRQIHNARTRNEPVSVIMLDVDFFKSINDTYGHLVGDRALQLFSARLRHNLRFYDTPFRYGGEEFVVILSDTGGRETLMIAKRLCQLISEQPFAINDELDLNVTVSAGIATLKPGDDAKGTSLLQRADDRLLQAKAQGRNRVVGQSTVESEAED
ncbi:MAG: diguanylate cyclase [Drouetiella hepatica Uher 2000/2452]|jgi:two-component system cell cycle response regulator|uniref:Diguanylate cyclase n=1 Tax=Drouetiella hepatica Uher 2000/2452 TaxID=904376 RepID=A0A951QFA4_9CYAN|nr:diguanylate cyclase [Drouetiella hepatica Uher 2000/2452]